MILFWLSGGLLAVAALALLLRPWKSRAPVSRHAANVAIYRDQLRELAADLAAGKLAQSDYDRSRVELETRLLEDVGAPAEPAAQKGARAMTAVVAAAIPLCALVLYLLIGNPGAIDSGSGQMEAMVQKLAAHLRENPDDAAGWKLLGRSYAALGRFPEAADALARAAVGTPRDAQLLADFADALAMARGQSLAGEPEKLLQRALELDPGNLKALALAGTAAFDRKDYAAAAAYWQRMLPLVPPESEDARTIRENVQEASRLAGTTRALKGVVRLSPALKARIKPDDTVFVFARAEKGPPMPLAVMRAQARELPLAFALDDSMAMAPGLALSGFPQVVITARVSRSGSAAAQKGDLQGSSAPVPSDSSTVMVLIDRVVN